MSYTTNNRRDDIFICLFFLTNLFLLFSLKAFHCGSANEFVFIKKTLIHTQPTIGIRIAHIVFIPNVNLCQLSLMDKFRFTIPGGNT